MKLGIAGLGPSRGVRVLLMALCARLLASSAGQISPVATLAAGQGPVRALQIGAMKLRLAFRQPVGRMRIGGMTLETGILARPTLIINAVTGLTLGCSVSFGLQISAMKLFPACGQPIAGMGKGWVTLEARLFAVSALIIFAMTGLAVDQAVLLPSKNLAVRGFFIGRQPIRTMGIIRMALEAGDLADAASIVVAVTLCTRDQP